MLTANMSSPITFPGISERVSRLERRLEEALNGISAVERELKEADNRTAMCELVLAYQQCGAPMPAGLVLETLD